MSDEEKIQAAAEQFGWEADQWDSRTVVLTRPGPMIDRKSTDRIVLQFTISCRLQDAYHGTDKAPTDFARPLLASVLAVITK